MMQIEFTNDIILDMGWYNSLNCFVIYLIKGANWESPVLLCKAYSLNEFRDKLTYIYERYFDK
jgi:hypothetical protein